MSPIDDGHAIHYLAVEPGVPVYDSEEQLVGKLVEVLDNAREHIMDGVVVQTTEGTLHFVDAPEVGRTAERGVTLTISAAAVAALPAPERKGPPLPDPVKKLFGGFRRR